MVILLGMEFVALGAAASKFPKVRTTISSAASSIYSYAAGDAPVTTPPAEASSSSQREEEENCRVRLRAVMLPELRGNPEAAECSVLRQPLILETLSNAMPRRFSGDVGAVWSLLFSTTTDGTSLAHMLRTVACEAGLL